MPWRSGLIRHCRRASASASSTSSSTGSTTRGDRPASAAARAPRPPSSARTASAASSPGARRQSSLQPRHQRLERLARRQRHIRPSAVARHPLEQRVWPTATVWAWLAPAAIRPDVSVRWSRYGHAAGPARRAVGVRRKSVQTDQLGLRGRCVLRRGARFPAPPTSARPRSFCAARVHASTAQSSVRYTGTTERLRPDTAGLVRFNPVANCA